MFRGDACGLTLARQRRAQQGPDKEVGHKPIKDAWPERAKTNGYLKICDELIEMGVVSENRVARLACLAGIQAQIGCRKTQWPRVSFNSCNAKKSGGGNIGRDFKKAETSSNTSSRSSTQNAGTPTTVCCLPRSHKHCLCYLQWVTLGYHGHLTPICWELSKVGRDSAPLKKKLNDPGGVNFCN